jgi:hypothetical protein
MKQVKIQIQKGDLIGVDGSRGFNHGCMDYAIIRYDGEGRGIVVEGQSCHSCWQVGHDRDHTFAEAGDTWELDESKIVEASHDWAASVKWELP